VEKVKAEKQLRFIGKNVSAAHNKIYFSFKDLSILV
jgi:hypothetical protein